MDKDITNNNSNRKTEDCALVTGGAKRIGKQISLDLAKCGYDIALNYNTSDIEAKETKKEIEALGARCEIFQADLANSKDVKRLFNETKESFNKVDLLVNNASIFIERDFQNTDEEFLDKNFNIHFKAPFFLSQEFAKHCDNGNIINITDTRAIRNSIKFFPYILSKKSLVELTKMTARILGPQIRVNAIAPGITTLSDDLSEEFITNRMEAIPLKSQVKPEQISKTLIQIIENDSITGQIFYLDGGEHLI